MPATTSRLAGPPVRRLQQIGIRRRRQDVHRDPQVVHLDLLVERDSGFLGSVRQPRPMWQFSETPALVTTRMGRTGQHTREVLREHGLPDARIDALISAGAIGDGS